MRQVASENLQAMGLPDTIIETTPEIDLERFGPLDRALKGVACGVLNFSKQPHGAGGFYDVWWTATQFPQATAALADAYARLSAFGIFTTPDEPIDWSQHLNGISMVICAVAGQILMDEGLTPDEARIFFNASAAA